MSQYFILMKACKKIMVGKGSDVHHLFDRQNSPFKILSSNSLLEMCSMCGSMKVHLRFFILFIEGA